MTKRRSVILIVLDGWGIGRPDFTNPIHASNLPNIKYLKENFPSGALQASGISVGLPWGEEGNSEVGHLNMGAGKIIYQNYPRITLSIRNKSFFDNEILKKSLEHVKKNNSFLNLFGLLTEANVHASLEHLKSLIEFAEQENLPKERINLHLITDGRDSPPKSALNLISQLPYPQQVASIAGRYYAMDRDKYWERTAEAYNALVGRGKIIENISEHLEQTYKKNLNDEYVQPVLVAPSRPVAENDALVFFNFREDRMRQIASVFLDKNFSKFQTKKFSNLFVAAMIQYSDNLPSDNVLFPPEKISTCLSKVLSENNKVQWRIAETEKYAHITYFFNGLKEAPFPNEFRVLIPSQPPPHNEHPEMQAREISQRLAEAVQEQGYDFILANFANADMVAHSGDFDATAEAVKIIDEELGKIMKTALNFNSFLIITADHGNAERLLNPQTGEKETRHDPNPVPVYLVAKEFQRKRSAVDIKNSEKNSVGVLADIAPTILELMGIKKPEAMTAQSLLDVLLYQV